MNLDTVELINEIMIRPEIWMTKHPANKNKWKTLSKWEEMKNNKFPLYTVDDLKKRWKNIKDQYRKELKKLPQSRPGEPLENITSNWKYFEYMSFMKDELVIYKEAAEREEGRPLEEHDVMTETTSDDIPMKISNVQGDASIENDIVNNDCVLQVNQQPATPYSQFHRNKITHEEFRKKNI